MNKYIVLLRGVNVGGKNLLPMKILKNYLLEAGFEHVETYIQSGNIILTAPNNPDAIVGEIIERKFGFKAEVLALADTVFRESLKQNPYKDNEAKSVHFYFCSQTPEFDKSKLEALSSATEEYCLINRVFYLYAPDGIGRSKLAAKLEKLLGVATTARNLNTVNKIDQLLNSR